MRAEGDESNDGDRGWWSHRENSHGEEPVIMRIQLAEETQADADAPYGLAPATPQGTMGKKVFKAAATLLVRRV